MPPKLAKSAEKTEQDGAVSISAVSKSELLAALAENKAALVAELNVSFERFGTKLDNLQQSIDGHQTRLLSLEDNAETVDERLDKLEACCSELRTENEKLRAKVTDLEGRGKRNNLRLVGLPESLEGPQPTMFFAQLLQEAFGRTLFPSPPELDRAHRSLAPKPSPGARPRPVLLCFHRYQQKELILREARIKDSLIYEGHSFRVYEDYPQDVVNQRREYREVMSSLYKLGLRPALVYPARLRITQKDGTRKWFSSVADAERYIEEAK